MKTGRSCLRAQRRHARLPQPRSCPNLWTDRGSDGGVNGRPETLPQQLHVFAARFNPLRWQQPERHFRDWAAHMLDSGVKLTVIECQVPENGLICARATSTTWPCAPIAGRGAKRTC